MQDAGVEESDDAGAGVETLAPAVEVVGVVTVRDAENGAAHSKAAQHCFVPRPARAEPADEEAHHDRRRNSKRRCANQREAKGPALEAKGPHQRAQKAHAAAILASKAARREPAQPSAPAFTSPACLQRPGLFDSLRDASHIFTRFHWRYVRDHEPNPRATDQRLGPEVQALAWVAADVGRAPPLQRRTI